MDANKWHEAQDSSSKVQYEVKDMKVQIKPNSSFMKHDVGNSLVSSFNKTKPEFLASADLINIVNEHDDHSDKNPVREKVNDDKEFHKLMGETSNSDNPNLTSSRRSRQLRESNYKTIEPKIPLIEKRQRILFDAFDETPALSSEIQTSLQILQQVKAQNEKYDRNEKPIINKLNQTSGPSSITQKFKQRQREKHEHSQEYSVNLPHTLRNQNITEVRMNDSSTDSVVIKSNAPNAYQRNRSQVNDNNLVNQLGKKQNYNTAQVQIENERDRFHSQNRNVQQRNFRETQGNRGTKNNKKVSASPASNFASAKDKADAHRNFIGAKKMPKYQHKPVHKVLQNFMDDDEDEEELIMQMLDARKKELYETR